MATKPSCAAGSHLVLSKGGSYSCVADPVPTSEDTTPSPMMIDDEGYVIPTPSTTPTHEVIPSAGEVKNNAKWALIGGVSAVAILGIVLFLKG
jgi:hypothetical protein